MRKLASTLVPIVLLMAVLGSCRPGVTMWSDCTGSDDKTATDSTYVLVCKDGTWQPVMTVGEFLRIKRGERVTIAPLPTRPTTTTPSPSSTSTTTPATSTTVPATSTTSGPTTSTTVGPTTTSTSTTTTSTSTTTTTAVPNPGISTVVPNTGPAAGGTSVTITGLNFTGTTVVTFGGAPASFTVNSDTQITATTPAHAAGSIDLVVTRGSSQGTRFNAFTYT